MWRNLRQGESRWTLFFILDANYSFDMSTQDDPTGFLPDNRLSGEAVKPSITNSPLERNIVNK